jgi:hypothetical protein
MLAHVPTLPATLHALQSPVHEVLQQTPSTQLALRHSAIEEHCYPMALMHPPEPLHTSAPAHSLSGSVPAAMLLHAPSTPPLFAAEHATHVPKQPLLQHTPSAQVPLRHWLPTEHGPPFCLTHAPKPLHTSAPAHSLSGSVFPVTLPQTPFEPPVLDAEQAWQTPAHATLQQKPSTQLPLAHWPFIAQALPIGSFETHVPALQV